MHCMNARHAFRHLQPWTCLASCFASCFSLLSSCLNSSKRRACTWVASSWLASRCLASSSSTHLFIVLCSRCLVCVLMTCVAARAGAARNGHCLQNCRGWLVLDGLPFDTTGVDACQKSLDARHVTRAFMHVTNVLSHHRHSLIPHSLRHSLIPPRHLGLLLDATRSFHASLCIGLFLVLSRRLDCCGKRRKKLRDMPVTAVEGHGCKWCQKTHLASKALLHIHHIDPRP